MASEMPPADAEQPTSLLAQYHKRLMWRLAAWGGAAAFSLAAAVIVSQTGSGNKRLQIALSGSGQPSYDSPASVVSATIPMPPADLIAVKRATEAVRRATDKTAAKLAVVERNTSETRAETRRLASQMRKLNADSFRVAGRLAIIQNQVDGITGSINGITGSIKKQAEEAVAAAVAKAAPAKPAFDKVFDMNAPVISPPAVTYPKLSLLMPPTPGDASKSKSETGAEVAFTSAITNAKDQSRVDSKSEAKAGVDAGSKMAPKAKGQIARAPDDKPGLKPKAMPKAMAKAMPKAAPKPAAARSVPPPSPTKKPPMKMTHVTVRPSYYSRALLPRRGFGADLGGADSVTAVMAQWAAVKANFGPILAGMRPTAVRDHQVLSGGEFRLVIGRVHSRKAAERLCKRLAKHQLSCQPVKFDDGRVVRR